MLIGWSVVASIRSATLVGVDAAAIDVEAELSLGLPYFSVIGLGSTTIQEARYRVQAALRVSGIALPQKKITINLAPASLRKEGASLDLAMALSLLVAADFLEAEELRDTLVVGELGLNGDLRPVRGVLAMASLARMLGLKRVIVPRDNGAEALAISGLSVLAPGSLIEVVGALRGEISPAPVIPGIAKREEYAVDFREVRGQRVARRAAEIAAAGGHNLLVLGNPGSGKTMLARRIPTILPPLTPDEQIEVTKVWSAAGLTIGRGGLMTARPFRAPHHTISEAGLIGGGSSIRPGEVSLAHRGVLFFDEMPETPRRVLESLRQPLEDREIVISRARHTARLPAAFMLVGAANPCPCGWLGHRSRPCLCTELDVRRYLGRLSGPLLDRIDMVIDAPSLTPAELMSEEEGEPSAAIRTRVVAARDLAEHRSGTPNALLHGQGLKKHGRPDDGGRALLAEALERLDLSARSVERVLRVARTIADLRGEPVVGREAIGEALQYRQPASWASKVAA